MIGYLKKDSRKTVDGSRESFGFYDTWIDSIDFVYDGVVTEDVCERIVKALHSSNLLRKRTSSRGALVYRDADEVHKVDTENKQVLIKCVLNFVD